MGAREQSRILFRKRRRGPRMRITLLDSRDIGLCIAGLGYVRGGIKIIFSGFLARRSKTIFRGKRDVPSSCRCLTLMTGPSPINQGCERAEPSILNTQAKQPDDDYRSLVPNPPLHQRATEAISLTEIGTEIGRRGKVDGCKL